MIVCPILFGYLLSPRGDNITSNMQLPILCLSVADWNELKIWRLNEIWKLEVFSCLHNSQVTQKTPSLTLYSSRVFYNKKVCFNTSKIWIETRITELWFWCSVAIDGFEILVFTKMTLKFVLFLCLSRYKLRIGNLNAKRIVGVKKAYGNFLNALSQRFCGWNGKKSICSQG